MKKTLFFLTLILCSFLANAQVYILEKMEAMQLVIKNKVELNLTDDQISNSTVSSTYNNKYAGTKMVYLQQTYKGVLVYNQLQTIAFKNEKVVSQSGSYIKGIENYTNVKSEIPLVNSNNALLSAIIDRKLTTSETPKIKSTSDYEHKVVYGNMGVSREDITTTLMWFPSEDGKKLVKLGWQVYIIQNNSADYWLVNIDATNKSTIGINNLTVYCNWGDPTHKNDHKHNSKKVDKKTEPNFDFLSTILNTKNTNSPTIVNSASYRVVPYPAESPLHSGGTPVLVTNPWELSGAGNNATSLKWHSVGATNYDITRGNNVWAQEDQNNNNGTSATQVASSTNPDPLTFDFVPDFNAIPTQTTPAPNQQFNTTNLFYWNNIIHDLTYQYGFDEASRNFQADNQGRGGNGGDYVLADAQDGGGTNNANFATPADGGNGRMQMYIWLQGTPDRDGDVDNGIVSHEYAHGISNRLTGTGSGCLGNGEQMGEGWSDYYSLMYTQNWATSSLNTGFVSPRGIGTYAVNQATTGLGIRSQRYCTDFNVNNKVYAATITAQQHSRGEIWCATLWDMTWGIINQVGSINSNLFNANGVGGNSIALKLVTEGMKLQPCSPGFISGRDAILQADQILYNGLYRCTILEAFRRRGMGLGASQGSSASVTDQIPSFTNGGSSITLLQNGTIAVPEGLNISYSNKVIADPCSAYTNYTITDTLPLNVTYVSGGTYNPANRVVSFVVNQASGTTGFYNFVVNINSGTYFAPVTLFNEPVPATLPSNWIATTTVPAGGNLFGVSTLQSNSAPNSFFCTNDVVSTDKRLELNTGIPLQTGTSAFNKLSFWHKYNTEEGWDGGVVEISTNGGTTWTDLGDNMLTNRYNSTLGAGAGNNLANRSGFSGLISGAFVNTTINLNPYAGQSTNIRFRFGSDDNTAGAAGSPTGWFIDDVTISNAATVSMRSSFFNASNVRVNFSDTTTLILPPTTTAPPVISMSPSSTTVCSGTDVTFTGAATSATSFNWQVSTNNGATWTNVVPTNTTTTLTLNAVTVGMSSNQYRLVATNIIGSVNSNAATLTVNPGTAAPTTTTPVTYCQGAIAAQLTATGTALLWYTAPTGGPSSGSAPTPNASTVGSITYYVTQTIGICESPRAAITVTVNATPAAPTVLSPVTYCQNASATALTATGTNLKWYTVPLAGTALVVVPTPNTSTIGSTTYYVSQTTGICEGPRAAIVVNVTAQTPAPNVTTPVTFCQGSTATVLNATGTGLIWYATATGGPALTNAPTPNTTTVGSTTFYVSQSSSCGESPRAAIVVNVVTTPAAPTVTTPIAYCQGNVATQLSATGTNLLWYANATGGSSTGTAPTPITSTIGTFTFYVSQTLGTCESPRAAITVNVGAAPAITTQPQDITSCATTATFTVIASGSLLTYQWQVSIDGGVTFTNIGGANAASLTLTGLTPAQANNKYRVVVSSASCSAATSVAVSAKVGVTPVIVLTSAPTTNFNPRMNGGLFTTVSPTSPNYVYQWKRNNNLIANTSTSLTKANGLLEEFGTYIVTVTDNTTGCFGISNAITVNDIADERNTLFISPNPTQGLINVSYYSDNTTTTTRKITVYDGKGAQVLTKDFTTTGRYMATTVNLSKFAAGNYSVTLLDANGKIIASQIVVKY